MAVRDGVGVFVRVFVGVLAGLFVGVGENVGAAARLRLTRASAHCFAALRLFVPPAVNAFVVCAVAYSGHSTCGVVPLALPADPATVAPSFAGPPAPPAVSPE